MNRTLDIAIVGYGTAGQALAVLLSRDGHRVQVFEQAATPGPVGAGFLLQPSGLQALWQMQLMPQVLEHGAVVRRLYGETPCGRAVMDMTYAGLDARLCGVGMQRGALFSLLDAAWDAGPALHVDSRISAIDESLQRVQDQHGRWHGPFDLVIATDGSGSGLRAQVQGTRLDRIYPWGALWCLLPRGDWQHGDELRQRYVAARKMIGLLPVGTRPGDSEQRLSFFWSLPRDGFQAWERDGLEPWLDEIATLWPEARARLALRRRATCSWRWVCLGKTPTARSASRLATPPRMPRSSTPRTPSNAPRCRFVPRWPKPTVLADRYPFSTLLEQSHWTQRGPECQTAGLGKPPILPSRDTKRSRPASAGCTRRTCRSNATRVRSSRTTRRCCSVWARIWSTPCATGRVRSS